MHQRVLHILAYASDQVNVVDKQFFEKALRDVSLVGHEFSEDFLRKLLVFQWGTIICIGWCQLPLDDFSAVVDNDVQFETEEPPPIVPLPLVANPRKVLCLLDRLS